MALKNKIAAAVDYLSANGVTRPDVSLVMGTGLGESFLDSVEMKKAIEYRDIPYFPEATVEFHHGKVITAEYTGKTLLIFKGRFHYYEGHSMEEITFPVRVAKALGARYLLMSNAAGAINLNWSKGDLMLVEDHINLQPENPLRGQNDEGLGPRFPDMSCPYDAHLNGTLKAIAGELDVPLHEGIYASVPGPNLETRAEYRYLNTIGADAVGMSTVPEVIVANHASLPCAVISVLTDECDPDNLQPIDINEIISIAGAAEKKLARVFLELIRRI